MNKPILLKSLILFISIWGIAVIAVWFRKSLEISWKLLATLIFAFYVWFFFEEILIGYDTFVNGWYDMLMNFGKELTMLSFMNLSLFWPLALIIIFYKADDIGAENLLKFMCIFTLVLWIVFIIYVYFSKDMHVTIYDELKKMVPYAK